MMGGKLRVEDVFPIFGKISICISKKILEKFDFFFSKINKQAGTFLPQFLSFLILKTISRSKSNSFGRNMRTCTHRSREDDSCMWYIISRWSSQPTARYRCGSSVREWLFIITQFFSDTRFQRFLVASQTFGVDSDSF